MELGESVEVILHAFKNPVLFKESGFLVDGGLVLILSN